MTEPITTIASGESSGIVEPRRTIVREMAEWQALWAVHAGPRVTAPAVDFSTHMVAAVFSGERPTPGFEVEIIGSRRQGDTLSLVVEERRPKGRMMAAQVLVSPFHIAAVPRHEGDVRFTDVVHRRASLTADATRVSSSTGLPPHVAAALAYLAGPFSGIVVLLAERTNHFVRFHAYQAILGLGGLGVLAVVLLVSAFAALLVSPSAFTALYRLAFATGIAWVLLWIFCLIQAFNGHAWRMPLVGAVAAKRGGGQSP
jgi:uncharacterized membrane protein